MQIVMRQFSGLGNQLFQYAAARYYAQHFGASFRLATDAPRNQYSHGLARPFLLSHFNIPAAMKPLSALERSLLSERKALQPAISALKTALGVRIFREPLERRYTRIDDIPVDSSTRSLYLFGYWQSWEIAEAVAPQLREDLRFRTPPGPKDLEVLNLIARTEHPVSLHVRRGDYTLAVEGNIALPIEYYTAAIRFFQQRLPDPTFFVFSDDIAFCRANLPPNIRTVFVDHNDDLTSHMDLRLMSSCRHHIVANSSFSWWGAWLNPQAEKMVYAPRYWLRQHDTYFPGLVPPQWTLGTVPA